MQCNLRPTLEGPLGNGIYVSRDLEDAKMKLLGFKPKAKPPPPIVVVPPKEKGTHSMVDEGHLVHLETISHRHKDNILILDRCPLRWHLVFVKLKAQISETFERQCQIACPKDTILSVPQLPCDSKNGW